MKKLLTILAGIFLAVFTACSCGAEGAAVEEKALELGMGSVRFPAVNGMADAEVQAAYGRLLGLNWVFAGASLVAYALSQSWDVFVFHRLRDTLLARRPDGRSRRWIWNNASTMSSQLLDTVVFVGLAFGCGLGWLFDPAMRPALLSLMLGQYLVKLALAALDTIPFYLLTRRSSP